MLRKIRPFQYSNKIQITSTARKTMKPTLVNIIKEEIKSKGPLTFAQFWQRALLHEEHGYYMKKQVFNRKGDFITSVEISQMFNEMIGVWIINTLQAIKVINLENRQANQKFHILEFGPGLGTLATHIIRVFDQFKILNNVQFSFIEFSDSMRKKQQENIIKQLQKAGIYLKYEYQEQNKSQVEKFTSNEVTLRWFKLYEQMLFEDFGNYVLQNTKDQLKLAPPIIILAHEFFDALPVNIFIFDKMKGWCERLVDVNTDSLQKNDNLYVSRNPFKFIQSDGPNENVAKVLKPGQMFSAEATASLQQGDIIEVCPQAAVIANSCAELISKIGGAALFIDYGENHAFSDSVRAIANHKILPKESILNKPGECDISAYVNFMALGRAAQLVPGIKVPQIMPQGLWLESMGITTRLEVLCQNSNKATQNRLESEYERLTKSDQMGDIFKFMLIQKQSYGQIFPFIEEAQQIYY